MKQGLFRVAVLVLLTGTCVFSIWTFAETRKAVVAAESAKEAAAVARSSATVSQEQAVQTRQEAESAKEAAKRAADEAEQTRKAADEALKKITLYKDFRDGVGEVREGYVSALKSAEEEFKQSMDSLEELARQRFILWASNEDSFLKRIRFSKRSISASGERMANEVFRELLEPFNDAVQQAELIVRESLYLSREQFPSSDDLVVTLHKSDKEAEALRDACPLKEKKEAAVLMISSLALPGPLGRAVSFVFGASAKAPKTSSPEASIEAIAQYAGSPVGTIEAIGEEAFTWIPGYGSVYELSRLAWDWRIKLVIEPSADAFAAAVRKRVEEYVGQTIQQMHSGSDELFEQLVPLHTPATLYAAYEASLH